MPMVIIPLRNSRWGDFHSHIRRKWKLRETILNENEWIENLTLKTCRTSNAHGTLAMQNGILHQYTTDTTT